MKKKNKYVRKFLGIVSVLFWWQPILRNYPVDETLDCIVGKVADSCDLKIEMSKYKITITGQDFEFIAWNANKYYAWLHSGEYRNTKTGFFYNWEELMASRYNTERLRKICAKETALLMYQI